MKRSVFILMLFVTGPIVKAGLEALPAFLPVVHLDALYVKVKHHPSVHSISSYHFSSERKFVTNSDSRMKSYTASPEFILPEYMYMKRVVRKNLHNRKRSMRQKLPLPDQQKNSVQVPP